MRPRASVSVSNECAMAPDPIRRGGPLGPGRADGGRAGQARRRVRRMPSANPWRGRPMTMTSMAVPTRRMNSSAVIPDCSASVRNESGSTDAPARVALDGSMASQPSGTSKDRPARLAVTRPPTMTGPSGYDVEVAGVAPLAGAVAGSDVAGSDVAGSDGAADVRAAGDGTDAEAARGEVNAEPPSLAHPDTKSAKKTPSTETHRRRLPRPDPPPPAGRPARRADTLSPVEIMRPVIRHPGTGGNERGRGHAVVARQDGPPARHHAALPRRRPGLRRGELPIGRAGPPCLGFGERPTLGRHGRRQLGEGISRGRVQEGRRSGRPRSQRGPARPLRRRVPGGTQRR